MRTKLVAIGNSKGVRLPRAILQQAGLEDSVTLRVEEGEVIIAPARRKRKPRAGWANAIAAEIAKNGPLQPIDPDWESLANTWDDEGWR